MKILLNCLFACLFIAILSSCEQNEEVEPASPEIHIKAPYDEGDIEDKTDEDDDV